VNALEASRPADHPTWSTRLVGAPVTLTFERVVEGEVHEADYPVMVEEIRATLKNVGHVSTLARSLAWTTASPSPGQGRDVHVVITPRNGQTRIRIEEKNTAVVGGLFGGVVGGGGGGGGSGVAVAVATTIGTPIAVIAAVVGTVGGFYWLARSIYRAVARHRSKELNDLIDRLADFVRESSSPRISGSHSPPRLVR
jgi:hypothetical protein